MKNSTWTLLSFIILSACSSSSSYKVLKEHIKDGEVRGAEISVTPDRISMECEDVSDENDIHGLMIHVLDKENNVIDFVHTGTFEKNVCFNILKKINKVVSRGNDIYLFGMGNFDPDPTIAGNKTFFPGTGQFPSNGSTFQFLIIKNERGDCYGAFVGDTECPSVGVDYFPADNHSRRK